jgi:uncharacterized protein YijF (DUF1287 family)
VNVEYRSSFIGVTLIALMSFGAMARQVAERGPLFGGRLVEAARKQIGVTVTYDPAYVSLEFPRGDVPLDRGVCTDVVIRAYRELGADLQELINRDMRANFSKYPQLWGLKRPDANIDHRRVPNLQRFFKRKLAELPVTESADDYLPGDLVTCTVPPNLPHIMIVSSTKDSSNIRPLVVHNIGHGTVEEDRLFEFPLTGHYRWKPDSKE